MLADSLSSPGTVFRAVCSVPGNSVPTVPECSREQSKNIKWQLSFLNLTAVVPGTLFVFAEHQFYGSGTFRRNIVPEVFRRNIVPDELRLPECFLQSTLEIIALRE